MDLAKRGKCPNCGRPVRYFDAHLDEERDKVVAGPWWCRFCLRARIVRARVRAK